MEMRLVPRRALAAVVCAIGLVPAGAALAVDGVIEINATSIATSGGFPFVIGATGSYVLTGNVVAAGPAALVVTAPDVVLDMNGFTLDGGGFAAGIGIDAAAGPGFVVKNGTIRGFAGNGLIAGVATRVMHMRIMGNIQSGIAGAADCIVVESTIEGNGGAGIQANRCKIENNIVSANGGHGISGAENVIVHNTVSGNGAFAGGGGILSFGGSTIQENAVFANTAFGISDTPGFPPGPIPAPPLVPFPAVPAAIPANNIMKNTVSQTPGGPGIFIAQKAVIVNNTVSDNSIDGIVCAIACQVSGNQVDSNNFSLVGNGGMTIGPGSTVNDNSISFNNGIGLVIDPTAGYMSNTLSANAAQDVSIAVPAAPLAPHPTSGLMNLCTGVLGPAPGLCP